MHCLYLSYDGMTDQLGQSQVIPYLNGLREKGYEFTILSFEKKDAFNKNSETIKDLLEKSKINWIPLTYSKSPPIFSTIYDYCCMVNTALKFCKAQKVDLIHCRSYISALAGLHIKKKIDIKYIFDMRGFWADERVDGKIWNLKNPVYATIYHYFKRKEKILLSNADQIISLTVKAREIIEGWKVKNLPPITVIPCCADTHHFDPKLIEPHKLASLRLHLGISENNLTIGYLGAIGTWYMLDEMLDFFKVLFQSNSNARFLFVSNESPTVILEAVLKKGIPSDSIIITSAKRAEVPLYISLMNLSIFFIKPAFSKKASSPTKMAELLSMGVPIICNSGIGDDDIVVEATGVGLLCHEMNIDNYIAIIPQINDLLLKNKSDLRKVAIENYSLEIGIQRYEKVYKYLTKKH